MKIRYILSLLIFSITLFGCSGPTGSESDNVGQKDDKSVKNDVDNDMCKEFTPDFVYSVINKPVVKSAPSPIKGLITCQYFTSTEGNGAYIEIALENLSVENQKKGAEMFDRTVSTDDSIKMEHMIITQNKDGQIWSIDLIINPNRYVWVNQRGGAITNEELIILASKMGEKIQGKLSMNIKKNPFETETDVPDIDLNVQAGRMIAEQFLDLLAAKKPDQALKLSDMDESSKTMWKTNFDTIESLQIKDAEPSFQEEWTSEREVYRFTLDISVNEQGEQFGWVNGENTRWISLTKKDGNWMVHEFSANP